MQTTGGLLFSDGVNIFTDIIVPPVVLQYWLNRTAPLSVANNSETTGLFVDTNDEIYLAGSQYRSSKLDSQGNAIWQKGIAATNMTVDPGGVYFTGSRSSITSGISGSEPYIAKYDKSNGTMVWQQTLGRTSGSFTVTGVFNAVVMDNGGCLIAAGSAGTTTAYAFMTRLDSNGAVVWKRSWNTTAINNIFVDVYNNVYVTGSNYLANYDINGTRQAGKVLGNTGQIKDLVADNTGNVYVTTAPGATTSDIIKLNSAMTSVIWQKRISTPIFHMTIDANDNIFIVGNYKGAYGTPDHESIFIAKIDTSGTILWQNALSYYYQNHTTLTGEIFLKDTDLYISGEQYVGSDKIAMLLKIPTDGSRTNTYIPVGSAGGQDRYDYYATSFQFTEITGGNRCTLGTLSSTAGADMNQTVVKTRSVGSVSDSSRPYERHLNLT